MNQTTKVLRFEGEGAGVRREIHRAVVQRDGDMEAARGTYRADADSSPGQLGVTYYDAVSVMGAKPEPDERSAPYIDCEIRGDSWESIREALRMMLDAAAEETPAAEPVDC